MGVNEAEPGGAKELDADWNVFYAIFGIATSSINVLWLGLRFQLGLGIN